MNVYVAGPYTTAPYIRDEVYPRLRDAGMTIVSTWTEQQTRSDGTLTADGGPDRLDDRDVALRAWKINRMCIDAANALLLVDTHGAGRETYAEVEYSLATGEKPVVWVGRRTLSSVHPAVVYVDSLKLAVEALQLIAAGLRVVQPIRAWALADFWRAHTRQT